MLYANGDHDSWHVSARTNVFPHRHSHYRLRSTKIHRVTHTNIKSPICDSHNKDHFQSPKHRLYQKIVLFYHDFHEKQKVKRDFIIANSCVRIEIQHSTLLNHYRLGYCNAYTIYHFKNMSIHTAFASIHNLLSENINYDSHWLYLKIVSIPLNYVRGLPFSHVVFKLDSYLALSELAITFTKVTFIKRTWFKRFKWTTVYEYLYILCSLSR